MNFQGLFCPLLFKKTKKSSTNNKHISCLRRNFHNQINEKVFSLPLFAALLLTLITFGPPVHQTHPSARAPTTVPLADGFLSCSSLLLHHSQAHGSVCPGHHGANVYLSLLLTHTDPNGRVSNWPLILKLLWRKHTPAASLMCLFPPKYNLDCHFRPWHGLAWPQYRMYICKFHHCAYLMPLRYPPSSANDDWFCVERKCKSHDINMHDLIS